MSGRAPQDRARDRGGDRDESFRKVPVKKPQLNEFWIDGEGINRQVLQMEICKYLGNDATCRPGDYEGRPGFKIKAVRPFTNEMLEDLRVSSKAFMKENLSYQKRHDRDLPYENSQTYENSNPPPDYTGGGAYAQGRDSPSYNNAVPGYGVPPGANVYPPSSTAGFPGASTYPAHAGISAGGAMPMDPRYASADYNNYQMNAGRDPRDTRDPRDPRDPRNNPQYGAYPEQYGQGAYGNDPYGRVDPRADPRMAQQEAFYGNNQYAGNNRDPRAQNGGYYDQMQGMAGPGAYNGGPPRGQMSPQYDNQQGRQDAYRGNAVDPRYRR